MLKNPSSKMSSYVSGLSIFDKLNIFITIVFFISAIVFPVASIAPIGDGESQSIRMIGLEYRKSSILIILLLASSTGLSLNGKFKAWFLHYTGISNDIYARFLHKLFVILLLLFFGEMIIHLRITLTQTINLARGYYFLSALLIGGLIVDFLFLQRKYKLNNAYQHVQTTIAHEESHTHEGQSFKNLFDQ